MPDSAETTISTRRPRARCAAAMRRMFSQRGRVETLVPPNLTTTHGAFGASEGAMDSVTLIFSMRLASRAFFLASQQNAMEWR